MAFNINPLINPESTIPEIVDYLRKKKMTKEWKDSDDMWRYSKLKIITKGKIELMFKKRFS